MEFLELQITYCFTKFGKSKVDSQENCEERKEIPVCEQNTRPYALLRYNKISKSAQGLKSTLPTR